MTKLVAEGVVSRIGDRQILTDVSLYAGAGELVALTGPSGSGKTTMINLAGGLLPPDEGMATLDGEPTWLGTGDPRPDVALILQSYGLVSILTAAENVSIALRARGVRPREADAAAAAALDRVGITDLGERLVQELSGGQAQRVACARALVVDCTLLLADEPTSELDEYNRDRVIGELRHEAERGAAVMIATHDVEVAAQCDREYRLDDGALVPSLVR
ncbi:ABC transporter ATP-binding protein [Solicola gregarius]|uniref:ABC transporter ATP-binding protein n=1 Tax=Solicola gregarius TaxID=2908642 RepID=A0AA46YKL9_9ACTN|nr:ABC transporter ATP-binding protein [Solicola gregarius]UYM05910.1 ABC transporter ATP-binding protein [Solicola gregarius]